MKAVVSRVFQFEAGPQRQRFHACLAHVGKLNEAPMCFLRFVKPEDQDTRFHALADEIECDFCREG